MEAQGSPWKGLAMDRCPKPARALERQMGALGAPNVAVLAAFLKLPRLVGPVACLKSPKLANFRSFFRFAEMYLQKCKSVAKKFEF
jgi:hypothetical protein